MAVPWLEVVDDAVLAEVWVVPGASRTEIVGVHGDRLKVRIAAPPEAGKANRALERLFERELPGAVIEVVAGSSGRRKRVRISGVSPAVVEAMSVDSSFRPGIVPLRREEDP